MRSQRAPRSLAVLWLCLSALVQANHGGHHLHAHDRSHSHHQKAHSSRLEEGVSDAPGLKRRDQQCQFPSDVGLVAVTPASKNAGWALSPDQSCDPDSYCPYACPPGKLMAQWDPKATSYSYPQSQNGGLYCDKSGTISKPFPDKPYCVDGTGSVGCKNEAGGNVAFCQTVLPGNEAMLIPTDIQDWAGLAVPDPDYWASTAAHYYINPPGTSTQDACVWGTKDHPIGNWSPYVAGANADSHGQTFLKIGWNPVYLEPATPFRDDMPKWGVKIECEGDGCNGLPCAIDPAKHSVNECSGSDTAGAGGATFCVVTVPKGQKANVVVFESDAGGSGGSGSSSGGSSSSSKSSSSSSSLSPPSLASSSSTVPSTSSSTSFSSSTTISSSSSTLSSLSLSSTSSSSSSISITASSTIWSSSSSLSSTTTGSEPSQTTSFSSTSSSAEVTSTDISSTSSIRIAYSPHIFVKNVTTTYSLASTSPTSTSLASEPTTITPARKQSSGYTVSAPVAGASIMMLIAMLSVALR